MIVYPAIKSTAAVVFRGWLKVRVEGKDNVPKTGPFIMLTNHQSNLDGLLVHAYSPRLMFSMTKSSPFKHAWARPILRNVGTFPARRHRVDPQVVRVALRYLGEGRAVGIHAEGERSWDGRIRPLRLGTIRLVLKAGVPVIPCGVVGAYDIWPRWDSFPVRIPFLDRTAVRIRFGSAMHFGRHDHRASREEHLDETLESITRVLQELTHP